MLYRDTAGNEEWIWNSRDGVTPFVVASRQGFESTHVDWQRDTYWPDYVPEIGERIFVTTTPERARERAESWYDRFATHTAWGSEFLQRYPEREKAISNKAQEILDYMAPCSPDLIVVTAEVQARIVAQHRERLLMSRLTKDLVQENEKANARLAELAATKAKSDVKTGMKITITPTRSIVDLNGVPCRIWTGKTERGIPVTLYVTRVQVDRDLAQDEFLRELVETEPPKIQPPL
jgi:hypothetical protein